MDELSVVEAGPIETGLHFEARYRREEIDEATGWLEFMNEGSIATDKALIGEATELCAILTASLTTARANWEAEQAARRRKKRARSIVVKFPEPRF